MKAESRGEEEKSKNRKCENMEEKIISEALNFILFFLKTTDAWKGKISEEEL